MLDVMSVMFELTWMLTFGCDRLTEAVQYRQVFGSVGQGQLANQYVLEVMPSDVWNVIAKMR